jgi:hypothetical protein
MHPNAPCRLTARIIVGLAVGLLTVTGRVQSHAESAAETVACRVIESKRSSTLGVELVVFHHAEAASREQLSAFLENHDGSSVEFQTAGGDWQPATVFRLKSCFGRGLLVFPVARAHLPPGQTFLIRTSGLSQ